MPNNTRRTFLKTCLTGAAALSATKLSAAEKIIPPTSPKSKVVIARDPSLYGDSTTPDSSRVQKLLDNAMQSFYDTHDPVTAWKKLVRPGEVVGLKVNTIAGPGLSTHPVLVQAICERLKQAGIKPNDIVIWDRTNHELERAGFHLSTDPNRERILGTDSKDVGYEDIAFSNASVTTRFSKLLTRTCTAMINLPILKDHSMAGITLSMKNMYGVVNNPADFHANNCCPFIPDLYASPAIKNKFRISICDAFTASYEGGPSFHPQYTWKFNGLMVATDPVAHDYTGWQIIEGKRAEKSLQTLPAAGRSPQYIAIAADPDHRLGTNDPARINVVEL
ncbi:MAG TPA: DUF362 domain-containing protein [Candidatus Acidoferrum sp.]|jgi:uncharacterized protein (DUF362 family)